MGSFSQFNALGLADAQFTLDMMANTDCTYMTACAALAVWESMGIPSVERCFDNGNADRSLKIGHTDPATDVGAVQVEPTWIVTLV